MLPIYVMEEGVFMFARNGKSLFHFRNGLFLMAIETTFQSIELTMIKGIARKIVDGQPGRNSKTTDVQ